MKYLLISFIIGVSIYMISVFLIYDKADFGLYETFMPIVWFIGGIEFIALNAAIVLSTIGIIGMQLQDFWNWIWKR